MLIHIVYRNHRLFQHILCAADGRHHHRSLQHQETGTEWSEHDSLLYYCGCIYVPNTSDLCHRIVSLCHDTKVAGYSGRFKTLELKTRVTGG